MRTDLERPTGDAHPPSPDPAVETPGRRGGGRRRTLRVLGAGAALALVVAGYQAATWPDVAALTRDHPASTAFIDRFLDDGSGTEPLRWTWVPAHRISAELMKAVVVAEDIEFFTHDGFSRSEMGAAIREAIEERSLPRGASTITQQLAKNLWLSPSRNPWRKVKEALLTRQLERTLDKTRILELYVNVVEFGVGIYGAEAAARHYFGKAAADLTRSEAALLAASLPRPRSWHPGVTSNGYLARADRIEGLTLLHREYLDRHLSPSP